MAVARVRWAIDVTRLGGDVQYRDRLEGGLRSLTRELDAVEASSGGERRALGYLGEVLVEKHPGD